MLSATKHPDPLIMEKVIRAEQMGKRNEILLCDQDDKEGIIRDDKEG